MTVSKNGALSSPLARRARSLLKTMTAIPPAHTRVKIHVTNGVKLLSRCREWRHPVWEWWPPALLSSIR